MRLGSLILAVSSKAFLLEYDSPGTITERSLPSVQKTWWGAEHKKGLTRNASPLPTGMSGRTPSIEQETDHYPSLNSSSQDTFPNHIWL